MSSQEDLKDKTFVDCSTVHPDTSFEAAQKLSAAGAHFIAAPVFGASPVAALGKLVFAVAGPKAQIERVTPLIQDVMGRKVINLGEDVKASAMLKVTGYASMLCINCAMTN